MDAIEFVKKFGIDSVKLDLSIVDNHGYNSLFTEDFSKRLKQILDAFELVEKRGGLAGAKAVEQQYWNSGVGSAMIISMELKQAIELVEKCNES